MSNPPNSNPEDAANIFSRLSFYWVSGLMSLARRKRKQGEELESADVYPLPERDETTLLTSTFEASWKKHGAILGPSDVGEHHVLEQPIANKVLYRTLKDLVGRDVVVAGVWKFFNSSLQFSFPFMLNGVISFTESMATGKDVNIWEGYGYAFGILLAMGLKAITENQYFFRVARSGWQVRSSVTTAVYQKSLRLTSASRQSKTLGEIVNVMQLDSTKLEMFMGQLHVMWDGLYQIVGYITIIYLYIGWAVFVGVGLMLIAVPVQGLVMKKLFAVQREVVKITDSRVKVTNECLQGIQGVKMASWESKFVESITEFRRQENVLLKRNVRYMSFIFAYMSALPAFTAVVSIVTYALMGGEVKASTIFTAISTFGQLRFALLFYPMALVQYVQAKVSQGRIAGFMAMDEIVPGKDPNQVPAASFALRQDKDASLNLGQSPESEAEVTTTNDDRDDAAPVIEIVDGEFYWGNPDSVEKEELEKSKAKTSRKKKKQNKKSKVAEQDAADEEPTVLRPVLQDVTVSLNRGELVAVVGPVASGKSSLCNAMLGELHQTKGTLRNRWKVAYAAQSPWILNATVRDNITFGEPYDDARYWEVIRVCQLTHDLGILDDGDQTMIGERGINLSGGQKQRISIARAAYSSKEVVMLDDPLSALDPEVARKVFTDCIQKFLKGRTVVLVTNQLNVLHKCSNIYVLDIKENGIGFVAEHGSYTELVSQGLSFSKLLDRFNGDEKRQEGSNASERRGTSNASKSAAATEQTKDVMENSKTVMKVGAKELMQKEERSRGKVEAEQYRNYIMAMGGFCVFSLCIGAFLLAQGAATLNSAWITIWTNDAEYENKTFEFYLVGYALTAALLAFGTYMRVSLFLSFGLRASTTLHKNLLGSVLHAPMSFFDTTPIGRIVSRFSKDIHSLDNEVPRSVQFFLTTSLMVLFSLGTIAYTTPLFLAVLPLIGGLYYYVLEYYRPVARDTKRLESISRSPVYAHFSETLGGLTTIRAFGESDTFCKDNWGKVDNNLKFWYAIKSTERWLSVRLELLGTLIAFASAVFSVYSAASGSGVSGGLAGLSLMFAISVTGMLNATVRQFAEMEAGMNSVERVVHYSKGIEQEAPDETDVKPDPSWPSNGEVVIKNLHMRYRKDTPLVLKGLTVTIHGGERVGLVGRTGSGKSSLMLSLMRLVEPEIDEEAATGPIHIDGVDISKIGLYPLRRHISIVPQNPTIFSGTIRSNLDPFDEYGDNDIWMALEKCHLKSSVMEYQKKLNHVVAESGDNFSSGQRQMLCLARAMLQDSRVLLLDEATSSVDFDTDNLIQRTIRESFQNTTIFTIAHRINTVIDNDRILVLGDGKMLECDDPAVLLANKSSHLSQMLGDGREAMIKTLKNLKQGGD